MANAASMTLDTRGPAAGDMISAVHPACAGRAFGRLAGFTRDSRRRTACGRRKKLRSPCWNRTRRKRVVALLSRSPPSAAVGQHTPGWPGRPASPPFPDRAGRSSPRACRGPVVGPLAARPPDGDIQFLKKFAVQPVSLRLTWIGGWPAVRRRGPDKLLRTARWPAWAARGLLGCALVGADVGCASTTGFTSAVLWTVAGCS
jgi:hypothetical protein